MGSFVIEVIHIAQLFITKNNEQKNIINNIAPKTSKVAIEKETKFYPVRDEHQNFYKKKFFKVLSL